MTTIGSQFQSTQSTLFPVEWPLTQTTAGSTRQPTVCRATTPQIKRRKKEHRNIVEQNKPCPQETTTTTDQQTADMPNCRELGTKVNHNSQRTSISDVKYEPTSPPVVPNIFKSLDHDEACWLVKEVNEANKSIFGAERTAEKLKQDDRELDKKKASLWALKTLLGDLRRNIKYPDEETAKDLDTLDEVSANFGVRNMVNCLGLLDSYFSELQKQLDK